LERYSAYVANQLGFLDLSSFVDTMKQGEQRELGKLGEIIRACCTTL
jgi:hypothetical protein